MKILYLYGLFLLVLPLVVTPVGLQAQEESREKEMVPVSASYAIKNATIIQSPGRKIENGTIVLKDGIILSVGKDVPVPPEAIIIKGDLG